MRTIVRPRKTFDAVGRLSPYALAACHTGRSGVPSRRLFGDRRSHRDGRSRTHLDTHSGRHHSTTDDDLGVRESPDVEVVEDDVPEWRRLVAGPAPTDSSLRFEPAERSTQRDAGGIGHGLQVAPATGLCGGHRSKKVCTVRRACKKCYSLGPVPHA